jgi:hypothetical protein
MKLGIGIAVGFGLYIAAMIYFCLDADKEQARRQARQNANIQTNSTYLCKAHKGVLYVTTEKTWQELNFIVYCQDNQRYDHLENFVITGE